jgi:hypothetical protein
MNKSSYQARKAEIEENAVLWRRPDWVIMAVTQYILEELHAATRVIRHNPIASASIAAAFALGAVANTEWAKNNAAFVLWWVGLGVLSSVGFGTGMHTFLLYLGPHIAQVALFAAECNDVDFNSRLPRAQWECDSSPDGKVGIMAIVAKVSLESFLWGLGTAIGELPPYLLARAARLAGQRSEELEEVDHEEDGIAHRSKKATIALMERLGFFGIVAMASIPNPLFDLAGLTCGHLLYPFWKFFGATLLGKAVIKSQLQTVLVVTAFNEAVISAVANTLSRVYAGAGETMKTFLFKERAKYHGKAGPGHIHAEPDSGIAGKIWGYVIGGAMLLFAISALNQIAQHYLVSKLHTKNKTKTVAASDSTSASSRSRSRSRSKK